MDPLTLQVKALIDWEYAGFFPPGMERWPGSLDQAIYRSRGDDVASAIAEYLPDDYLECYDQWDDKAKLDELIKHGQLPDPQTLRQTHAQKHKGSD